MKELKEQTKTPKYKFKSGYTSYKVKDGTMYIDHKRKKALLSLDENKTGMGGSNLTIESDGESTIIKGPFFYPYEEACLVCNVKL